MNQTDKQDIMQRISSKRIEVSIKKAKDYATDTDCLSNFKRVSAAALSLDINVRTPIGYALFMGLMKLDRLNNLMGHSKSASNESIEDTVMDLENYIDLAYCLDVESKQDFSRARLS